MRDKIFKSSPIHASVIISFPEFAEFSESSAPFRKNSNITLNGSFQTAGKDGLIIIIIIYFLSYIIWDDCFMVVITSLAVLESKLFICHIGLTILLWLPACLVPVVHFNDYFVFSVQVDAWIMMRWVVFVTPINASPTLGKDANPRGGCQHQRMTSTIEEDTNPTGGH